MHGSNDNGGGNKWISDKNVEWIGPDKYKNYERLRESSKPNTQLGSSGATSAGSSKDKGKSK
ncbi:hypothetical protein [Wolbachia endosymbiont (group A) of Sphaerophoria taeniata]|uniref:hypothetical protein n=1 Tax=Wolbachia endosymbiont (group A) of Sphaerophoria taeniata TaxID=2954057 RepID=UPI00222805CD|nr:hypothetical protein [Wolbachia endosymbiont (group A) of Sphaerophoria taeniata]